MTVAALVRSQVRAPNPGADAVAIENHVMRNGLASLLMLVLLIAAVWVYRERGRHGQMVITAYLLSLVATQASVTIVFKTFPYFQAPCLLTACQLLFQVLASQTLLKLREETGSGVVSLITEMGVQEWVKAFFPLAFCMTFAVLAHNASIMYIGLGLSSIMSALTPTITALMCMAFGQRYPLRAWVGMAIVCFGALVTMNSIHLERADRRKFAGCALAFAALICRAMKTTLQDLFMRHSLREVQAMLWSWSCLGPGVCSASLPKASEDKPQKQSYDPLQVWALQSPLMFAVCAVTSAWLEGLRPWRLVASAAGLHREAGLVLACLVSAAVSCLLGITALTTVKLLGAAAAQIVGKLNIIITAVFAMTFMNEDVGRAELFGGLILVLGAYIFEREAHRPGQGPAAPLQVPPLKHNYGAASPFRPCAEPPVEGLIGGSEPPPSLHQEDVQGACAKKNPAADSGPTLERQDLRKEQAAQEPSEAEGLVARPAG
eukprot:TRINITY_DN47526_c0_g1_i1.p1 TRINITY_DN47526_c0_g1~~TRINITY_DN47526_c0_g1_i1.p1  ORF type:complete len:490 (-),score=78.97 TRINITY_DN47526_c0_g1_i1:30-1499(-)